MAGVRFPAGARHFSLLRSVQTSSEAHPASHQWVPEVPFLEVKQPGREADHSSLFNAEVRNGRAIPLLPYTCSRRSA
jgi:hypothetical protein